MGHPIAIPTVLAAPLVVLAAFAAWQTPAVAADDCLAAPNAPTPKGQHWYYHLERSTGQKCWYLRALSSAESKPAQAASAAATASSSQPHASGGPAASAQASVRHKPAPHAQQLAARPSARSVPVEQPVQSHPVEEASAVPGPQGGTASAAAPSQPASDQSASGTTTQSATGTTTLWPDPPPAPTLQQADAAPGQSIAMQGSSVADANTSGSEASSQDDTTSSIRTATATPAAATDAAAPADAAAPSTGTLMQNALIIALSLLLAGFVFAIVAIARRRVRTNARELNSQPRFGADPYRSAAASEAAQNESDIRYTEAREGSLVPEQVTLPRPFAADAWQGREMPSRHAAE